jgi:hypothetical protein
VTNNAGTSYDPATCITPAAIANYVNAWVTSVTIGTLAADWNNDGTVTPVHHAGGDRELCQRVGHLGDDRTKRAQLRGALTR